MAAEEFEEKTSIIGRSAKDIEKYGARGTAYLGKVVMSAGERPVLGRKIVMDIAKPHVVLICGKRGGGKCLDGDTEIVLENGVVKKIRDLEKDSNQVMSLGHDYKIKSAEKTKFFKRPVSKMLEVRLRSGKKIRLTPEHPLLTIEGWKPAEELGKGSRIATPRKIESFGHEFIKECQVKLLAYLIAEGHTKRRTVWFSNSDREIINDFKLAVKEFDERLKVNLSDKFNFRVVNPDAKQKIVKAVRTQGKFSKGTVFEARNSLREWLKENGLYDLGAHEKFVPDMIIKSPKPKIALFLNRLFSCNGTIYFDTNTNSWRISFASVSEKLIRQVQHLLLRFEILSVLRKKNNKCGGKTFKSYELELKGKNVQKFIEEIGLYGEKEEKQEEALKHLTAIKKSPNIDTIPKEIWQIYRPKNWADIGRKLNYSIPKGLRTSINYSPSREKLLQIARTDNNKLIELLASSDIYWDEIKEVKELQGNFYVYDISVPENSNFIANDIIVHNSYSMAVMLEAFAAQPPEIKNRLAIITIDTVGIFWTLKIPSKYEEKELFEWNLEPKGIKVRVLVPEGKLDFYKKKKLPVDGAFTLRTSELATEEWLALFNLTWKDAEGVLLSRVMEVLKRKSKLYGIPEIIKAIKADKESDKLTKQALANRFKVAKGWGLFEKTGTPLKEIAKPGAINIIDVSAYRQAIGMQGTRDIIVALLGKKLFEERMLYRKEEEARMIAGKKRVSEMPLVWMLIDEAHMFMPKGEKSIALDVLLEWVRVGRQPGLSIVLATQRPNKLHPDAISQCDLFISHRMTAQPDIEAVSQLRPSYLHQNFDKYYQEMPRAKGYALILDDQSEKLWMVRIRPRFSWDGGKTASAFMD